MRNTTRREFIKTMGAVAITGGSASMASGNQNKKRPNILFLMSDQQQAWTADPASPCVTPGLDRLCQEGVRLTRAHTVNAICSPSRATLFTGVYPSRHGMVDCTHTVEDYRARFRTEFTMWSQRLKDLGYRTAYFGKWHVERSEKLERFGFDTYELNNSREYQVYRESIGLPKQPQKYLEKRVVKQKGYRDFPLYAIYDEPPEGTQPYYLYSRGIEFLREAVKDPNTPWCLFLSTLEPHDPFDIPKTTFSKYAPDQIPKPANFNDDLADKPAIYRRIRAVWKDLSWEEYAQATRCYYALCSLIDEQVQRILKFLDENGQADNTIVIYTTDHGEQMGGHGLMLKGVPPFEETYNIPLIIKWPGVARQRTVCDSLVSTSDIAPTIIEMTGAEPLPDIDGRSLVPLLKNETVPGWLQEGFAEFHGQRFFYTQRIVWDNQYKYVFNGFDFDELYDLRNDPHEIVNLASNPKYRDVAERLAAQMWKQIHTLGDHNMFNARYGTFRFAPVGPDQSG